MFSLIHVEVNGYFLFSGTEWKENGKSTRKQLRNKTDTAPGTTQTQSGNSPERIRKRNATSAETGRRRNATSTEKARRQDGNGTETARKRFGNSTEQDGNKTELRQNKHENGSDTA